MLLRLASNAAKEIRRLHWRLSCASFLFMAYGGGGGTVCDSLVLQCAIVFAQILIYSLNVNLTNYDSSILRFVKVVRNSYSFHCH